MFESDKAKAKEMVFDFSFSECDVTYDDIKAANSMLKTPFSFYGGYLQMSKYQRDNFLN